mmetsp:Transcript_19948/g.57312  ORF Transcript_19948/g.57312 Transcript_19948/m.57312 type:complete len:283 (-) Transcript_19948:735-1583(-)
MIKAPGIRYEQPIDAPTGIDIGVCRGLRRNESSTRRNLDGNPLQHGRVRAGLSRRQCHGFHLSDGPVEAGDDLPIGRQGTDDVAVQFHPDMLARSHQEGTIGGQFHLDAYLEQRSVDHRRVTFSVVVPNHPGIAQPQNQFLERIGRLGRLGNLKQPIVQRFQLPSDAVPLDVAFAFLEMRTNFLLLPGRHRCIYCGGMIECIQRTDESLVGTEFALGGPRFQIVLDGRTGTGGGFLRLDPRQAQPARRGGGIAGEELARPGRRRGASGRRGGRGGIERKGRG